MRCNAKTKIPDLTISYNNRRAPLQLVRLLCEEKWQNTRIGNILPNKKSREKTTISGGVKNKTNPRTIYFLKRQKSTISGGASAMWRKTTKYQNWQYLTKQRKKKGKDHHFGRCEKQLNNIIVYFLQNRRAPFPVVYLRYENQNTRTA